ncbi:kunitz-like toxin PcKuz3 [Galleria mellonella]|uniref:Kunitz-like toxin PcKuz3 n=1 Tax=Galleria mellonella TaxID=7137 RepID=A0ABM3MRW3_GALME|nr:kunitz-like toxin PcKuz3 [Galleria mellonella]
MGKLYLFLPLIVSVLLVSASEDICLQKLESGRCLAYMPRYGYQVATKKCERFIYGGCGQNDNNFVTLEECQRRCERP